MLRLQRYRLLHQYVERSPPDRNIVQGRVAPDHLRRVPSVDVDASPVDADATVTYSAVPPRLTSGILSGCRSISFEVGSIPSKLLFGRRSRLAARCGVKL